MGKQQAKQSKQKLTDDRQMDKLLHQPKKKKEISGGKIQSRNWKQLGVLIFKKGGERRVRIIQQKKKELTFIALAAKNRFVFFSF